MAGKNDYRKRKIREGIEIKKAKYNRKIKVLNRDEGNLVKTNTLSVKMYCIKSFLRDLVQLSL